MCRETGGLRNREALGYCRQASTYLTGRRLACGAAAAADTQADAPTDTNREETPITEVIQQGGRWAGVVFWRWVRRSAGREGETGLGAGLNLLPGHCVDASAFA